MLRSKGAFALLNNLILSKMLTFAPGKLFASYYTSFIHCCTLQLPASAQLLSTPSWEHMRHSAGSHNHQEDAHSRSITKALRTHGKTLLSYSRHIPRRGRAQEGRGPLQRHVRHRARHPGPRRTRACSVHGLQPSHFFFSSSLSLGAGSSVVFLSLSHQSFQNFSSSTRFFSFASLSSRLESMVANHSSRAASSSARVAYWFMQLFIAFCCVRHEKVAVKVLVEQQAAKSKRFLSIACHFVLSCLLEDIPLTSSAHLFLTRL